MNFCISAISEYLGIIAVLNNSGIIYVWDYCTFQPLGMLSKKLSDVSSMCFLSPYPILLTLHHAELMVLWDISEMVALTFHVYYPIVSLVVPNLYLTVITTS